MAVYKGVKLSDDFSPVVRVQQKLIGNAYSHQEMFVGKALKKVKFGQLLQAGLGGDGGDNPAVIRYPRELPLENTWKRALHQEK